MGSWPLLGFGGRVKYYPTTGYYASIPGASSSADTWGEWTEVVASTPYNCVPHVGFGMDTQTSYPWAIEVGVGADSSEVTIVEPIINGAYIKDFNSIVLPILIPSGTRISIRAQYGGSVVSPNVNAFIGCIDIGGFQKPSMTWGSYVDSIGWNSGTTTGTTVDPGGTVSTHGSWVEFSSATAEQYKGFFLSNDGDDCDHGTTQQSAVDVGVGPNGSEQEILSDFNIGKNSFAYPWSPSITPVFPITIPEGTRICLRSHCNQTSSTTRVCGWIFHGIR